MLESFRLGGFVMFPTALFGLVLLAVAVRYALAPEKRLIPLQIALALLTLATGALGFVLGVTKSATALEGLEPARAGQLFTIGIGESLHNLGLALTLMSFAALAICIGTVRAIDSPGLRSEGK